MYWNYRLMRFSNTKGEIYYEVCEVYYDENGNPHSWAESHNLLAYETVEEIKDAYENIEKAFEKTVLEYVNGKIVEVRG